MMVIIRLYPLHHQANSLPEPPKHVGETVFDSSLHPAEVAQLIALHQLGRREARPSWRLRLSAWYRRLQAMAEKTP
ncbi:hypothetical protein [Serratia entomophila]|jgi:hypothetical protein|uniref:hypothetical protein n=1 Tax=Serratia entomophila TaxID=42906 RepID=UPI002178E869|nr:hypothetical protein [Serratia entomophila]CAI0925671.1 Uncharacterised protein [Serratia entomophila]CAI0928970.1 Uncharacterised protein [Serratia entomophila]CAI0933669.1 Uncharacterised protein [Serratia entomophila]CAI0964414.1 Uncharacterised protein [Serratia entomophila]CAI1616432.1 Uncharacterised protein [Serratia entomophila]